MRSRIKGKLTNADLARIIHETLDIPLHPVKNYPTEGAKIIKALVTVLKNALKNNESIYVRGFGKFYIHQPPHRRLVAKPFVYNKPGQYSHEETVQADVPTYFPARKKIIFQPSTQLTAMLNVNNPTAHEKRSIAIW
jgi:nucleoid DNA-binding protein